MPLLLTLLMTALMAQPGSSFYDLKTQTLVGNKPADLGAYRGKVTLVVNVASYCGYTPQYKGLEALHRELAPKGFAVLGFPSNDFGEQEPDSAEKIACTALAGSTATRLPLSVASASTKPPRGAIRTALPRCARQTAA